MSNLGVGDVVRVVGVVREVQGSEISVAFGTRTYQFSGFVASEFIDVVAPARNVLPAAIRDAAINPARTLISALCGPHGRVVA